MLNIFSFSIDFSDTICDKWVFCPACLAQSQVKQATPSANFSQYFGNSKAGFTIPDALTAIFDQGAGVVIAINVFDPEKHETVTDVTLADIIGNIDVATGKRSGLKAFEDCYSLFGYYPKTIIAPIYCESTELLSITSSDIDELYKKFGLVDDRLNLEEQMKAIVSFNNILTEDILNEVYTKYNVPECREFAELKRKAPKRETET